MVGKVGREMMALCSSLDMAAAPPPLCASHSTSHLACLPAPHLRFFPPLPARTAVKHSLTHRLSVFPHHQVDRFMKLRLCVRGFVASVNRSLSGTVKLIESNLEVGGKEAGVISARWVIEKMEGLALPHSLGDAHDAVCAVAIMAAAFVWIQLIYVLVRLNFVERKLSRKLLHISTGILFVLAWPIFSKSPWSRFYAVLIPLVNTVALLIYGRGVLKDGSFVNSISREGNPEELLRGPLCYTLVLSFCTLLFWRNSPVGVIALAMMCGGDGIADIIGRKIGGVKLPYNHSKSWAGSTAMLVFGFWLSLGFVNYYCSLGFYHLDRGRSIVSVAFISFAATVVESLPIASKVDDNISVPMTAIVLGLVLFAGASIC